jgi:hypothetical protein
MSVSKGLMALAMRGWLFVGVRFHRGCARALAVLLLFLMAACSDDTGLRADAPPDPSAVAGDGFIVLGWRVLLEPYSRNWLVGGDYPLDPFYGLDIYRETPDGVLARPRRRILLCSANRPAFGGAFSDCDPTVMQYRVIAVPPGQYLVGDFFFQTQHLFAETNFIRSSPGGVDTRGLFFGDPVSHPERSFSVAAGEIVYIGDLSFDASQLRARVSVSRDDAAARFAADQIAVSAQPMVFRSVAGP